MVANQATAPIASATSAEQIKALVEATELRLPADEVDLLTEASKE